MPRSHNCLSQHADADDYGYNYHENYSSIAYEDNGNDVS